MRMLVSIYILDNENPIVESQYMFNLLKTCHVVSKQKHAHEVKIADGWSIDCL